MSPSSRRLLVLPLVALLLGLAAWFMSRNEKPLRPPPSTTVSFPTEMTPRDAARARARRTHQLPTPENATDTPRAPVDPLLAVLPTDPGAGAVVLEANAIRNSPLGETLLACMGGEAQLAEFRERSGVDLLNDLDRMAITTQGVSLTGHFADADWDAMFPDASRTGYGEQGRIYEQPERHGIHGEPLPRRAMGVWGNSMVLMGTPEEVEAAIDQLEGRGAPGTPIVDASQAYGEVYGVIGGDTLAMMLGRGGELGELPPELREAASRLELHADTLSDLGMVARFAGEDPARVEELGKTFNGLLSVARARAQLEGEEEAVRLLDMAKVSHGDAGFDLQLAVPQSFLEEMAQRCREEYAARAEQARAAREEPAPAPAAETVAPASGEAL